MQLSTHISEFEAPLPDPQPYVQKALALLEMIRGGKRGKIVFIAGELGSGKSEVVRSLAQALLETQPAPTVIAGGFDDGKYRPLKSQIEIDKIQAAATLGDMSSTLAKIISPRFEAFLNLGGQVLQAGASHLQFVKDHLAQPPKMPETPYWLLALLRHAAEEKPLVA